MNNYQYILSSVLFLIWKCTTTAFFVICLLWFDFVVILWCERLCWPLGDVNDILLKQRSSYFLVIGAWGISCEFPSQWISMDITDHCSGVRHNERDGVSNHHPLDYLLNRLFRRRSKKTPKFRVTGLCEGNWPVTGEFPAQRASNAENVSIWWRHHVIT